MRRAKDKKSRAKAGVTLVEVMIAGALTSLAVLFLLFGFTLPAAITKKNCKTLRDDNVAFDLIWREFNRNYEELQVLIGNNIPIKTTYDTDSPYRNKGGSDPLASADTDYPQYKYKLKVESVNGVRTDDGLRITLRLYDREYPGNGEDSDEEKMWRLKEFSVFRSNIPR